MAVGQRLHPDDYIGMLLRSEKIGRCSAFPRLLRRRNEFRSDRAATMCAASAIFSIRSNSPARFSRRFVPKTRNPIGHNNSKAQFPLAAS